MLSTGALRAHLLAARLAGPVATPRETSLRSYRLFAARDPRVLLGLDPDRAWGERDLLRLMADKCGVSGDPGHVSGPDVIDPERTLAALEAFARRLAGAAERRAPVLFGTGHPHRLLGFYAGLADALSAAGCVVLTPAQGRSVDMATRFGVRTYSLDYVQGVALVREPGVRTAGSATGAHTHSPLPVRAVLEEAVKAGGRFRSWWSGTTAGSAGQVSWVSRPSGWLIRTTPRCSWVRRRGGCPWPFRSTTGCGRTTTALSPGMYSIERVCPGRRPIVSPLPHSHHAPLIWGVSAQRRRVTGGEAGARLVRKVQVGHGC